jgi:hypothetical protein
MIGVNPAGLSPGLHTAIVTITPLGNPAGAQTVDIRLHVRSDVAITWTQLPPASIAPGQAFSLGIQVAANSGRVVGEMLVCPAGVAPDRCIGTGPFRFEGLGEFDGPPGEFVLRAERTADCETGGTFAFYPTVFLDLGSELIGPFVGPSGTTSLLPVTTQPLSVQPVQLSSRPGGGRTHPHRRSPSRVDVGATSNGT